MNISTIKFNNISNGVGVRTSIFITGCHHACKGCFNREIWSKNSGEPYTDEHKSRILSSLQPRHVAGLSLLGGEPMEYYNVPELIELCKEVRELYPNKDIWVYSGYTYEQILQDELQLELLKLCDVLIDGKYVEELYSPLLRFRGSSNQRVIDIQQSLKDGQIVPYFEE